MSTGPQRGRQIGGKVRPEPSLSKQPKPDSHSRPPCELLQAWKHSKLVPSKDMQRACVPKASAGQSAAVLQLRVHIRAPAVFTLKHSVPDEQPPLTVHEA